MFILTEDVELINSTKIVRIWIKEISEQKFQIRLSCPSHDTHIWKSDSFTVGGSDVVYGTYETFAKAESELCALQIALNIDDQKKN